MICTRTRTRRQMLADMGAVAIAPLAAQLCAAEDAPSAPLIVDTHQHLWDLTKFTLDWLKDAPPTYRRNYRPQEYAEATKGLNVRSVYMEVDVIDSQKVAEAEYVIDLCRNKTGAMRAAVIGGHPGDAGFAEYIKRFANNEFVRGVRQVLAGPTSAHDALANKTFIKNMHLLGELGLSFDLCVHPTQLRDGARIAELCPRTRFVLDHCGNADVKAFLPAGDQKPAHEADAWKRDLETLARQKNAICKISGIVAGAPEKWTPEMLAPIVNHCLDTFGPDRVVFGGDWPVCLKRATLRQWVRALAEIIAHRGADEQAKLWSENANKFYSLSRL